MAGEGVDRMTVIEHTDHVHVCVECDRVLVGGRGSPPTDCLCGGKVAVYVSADAYQGAVDALRPYLSHGEDCSWRIYGPAGPCECGLTDALRRFGGQS